MTVNTSSDGVSPTTEVLILGCGVVGVLAGNAMVQQGLRVHGVRRQPDPQAGADFPITAGDIAATSWWTAQTQVPARILLCANPGLRRGRDNGLAAAAQAVARFAPHCRFVYTGSSAVYADAAGAAADEQAPVAADDPAIAGLLAIEQAVAQVPDHLILRVTALIGPTRTHVQERLARGERTIRGDPERPFSYVHEADAAAIAVRAITGALGRGVLNVAAPEQMTVRDYYQRLAHGLGLTVELSGDGAGLPARRIAAEQLYQYLPNFSWRAFDA